MAARPPRAGGVAAAVSRVGPRRIVCLTEDPTEILYALGEQDRIVGISAYTVRPPEAARDKPVVSAFVGGSIPKITALKPDLVIGFSDVQADLARELIRANLQVLILNQRSIDEILDVVTLIGGIVGAPERAAALVDGYRRHLDAVAATPRAWRPRVYFEEWPDPMISGIRWVSELVAIAGGQDVFAGRAGGAAARDRVVAVEQVREARPDVILASWCGKPFEPDEARARLAGTPAVTSDRLHEVPAELILQPGPAALTDGLDTLVRLLHGAPDRAVGA